MGSFIREKQKKLFGHLTVCLVLAHGKVTIWPALDTKFAVCIGRAHGELTIVRRVPAVRAHGEQPPTPSAGRDGVCSFFFAVRLYIHTANKFAVCPTFGTRQTRSLPSPWLPSALCLGHRRRSLRRVPTGLRRVPRAHGELVVSGSEPSSPEVGLVGLAFSSYASFVAISKI